MTLAVLPRDGAIQCVINVKIPDQKGVYYPALLTYRKSDGPHGVCMRFSHPILPGREFVALGAGVDPLHPFQEAQRLLMHLDWCYVDAGWGVHNPIAKGWLSGYAQCCGFCRRA